MKQIAQLIREAVDFFRQLYLIRMLILNLSLRDFQKKYIRNLFGLFWAVLDPIAFVIILYLVFSSRFGGSDTASFAVYLITGQVAFEFFSGSITSITTSISEHSFLLRKVNFRVAILPIVTLVSHLMIHCIVLFVTFIILFYNGVYPNLYWFQLLYYIIALSVLLVSMGWLTSAIYLFFPDISNIIQIVTRALFFLTPIFWNIKGQYPDVQRILKMNPLYYIVTGYRESLTESVGFWHHPWLTLLYWSVCLVFMVAGVIIFKRLRPHFADVAPS